jgi:hypothetical protein
MESHTVTYKPRYVNTLYTPHTSNTSRDSSVDTVTRQRAKQPMNRGWIPRHEQSVQTISGAHTVCSSKETQASFTEDEEAGA